MKKNNIKKWLHFAYFITGIIFLMLGILVSYNLIRIKKYNDLNNELCNMYMSEYDEASDKNYNNGENGESSGGRDLKEGSGGSAGDNNAGIGNNSGGTDHTGINTEDIDSILVIKKIDLEMPVFNGSKRSGYLERFFLITGYSENEYGNGNYYIFGHQSRTFGYSLNRLNSLSIGDEILIYKSGEYHTYYVESITKTWEMIIDRNTSETTDSIIIYTCDKSKAANKPYIKLCAGRKTE